MAVKVVDASALAALLFGEPGGEEIADRLGNAQLTAPSLLPYEIASVCLKKRRKYPDQRASLLAALSLLPRLKLNLVGVAPETAFELAERTNLTPYDAAYLWLSLELGSELVTLDRRLELAFRKLC